MIMSRPKKASRNKAEPHPIANDAGLQAVGFVFKKMQIDDQWSRRQDRGFTWIGHRLTQRVWAEPMQHDDVTTFCAVHAETNVLTLKGVKKQALDVVNSLNPDPCLNAWVLDPRTKSLSLLCKVHVHPQNVDWVSKLLLVAVALQVIEAEAEVERLADQLHAEPLFTAHPTSGTRSEPDDILNVIDGVQHAGGGGSPWNQLDFEQVEALSAGRAVLATSGGEGVTVELPFAGSHPLIPGAPMTALFTAKSDVVHPWVGSGCSLRLRVPFGAADPGPGTAPRTTRSLANDLNRREATEATMTHHLGAWSGSEYVPVYSTFIPAVCYKEGLLANLFLSNCLRTQWARNLETL
jgi:hypothetical protein